MCFRFSWFPYRWLCIGTDSSFFSLFVSFVFNSVYLHLFSFIRECVRIWIGFIGSIVSRVFFLFSFYSVTNIVCCTLHTHSCFKLKCLIFGSWCSVAHSACCWFFFTIFSYFSLIFCIRTYERWVWCQDSNTQYRNNRRSEKKKCILENASEMSKTRKRF